MDLTQEIFVSVLQSIHRFNRKKARFRTWLYTVATRRLADYYRSRYYKHHGSSSHIELEEAHHPVSSDFVLDLERKEDVERVLRSVNAMEAVNQELLRLKWFAGCTFAEIAETMEWPESTIKTRYYSLVKRIQQEQGGDNDERG